jgi:hypothetical protein
MQDLERELADYGAVLRDRAPAVRLEEAETRLARPQTGHRPVRSAAAGALVALASIGLVFMGGLLVDLIGTPSTNQRPSVSPASGGSTGPAVMAIVVGSGALAVLAGAAAVGLKQRRKTQEPKRIAKTRERRKKKMQTIERPVAPVEKLARNNRYLIIGLVVAVLLAAGFGAWLIVDNTRTNIEADIVALLDDYGAAWEANDGTAVLALMTEDGAVLAGNGVTYRGDALRTTIDTIGDFPLEPTGDLVIYEGVTGWHVASADEHGMELFKIVEQDGTMLISFHETWRGGS